MQTTSYLLGNPKSSRQNHEHLRYGEHIVLLNQAGDSVHEFQHAERGNLKIKSHNTLAK